MAMHFKINIYANGCKIRQLIKSSPARFLFVNILHSKKEGILFTKVQRNIGYETQQKLFLNFPLFYLLRMKIQKINFPTHDILVWKIKEWEFQKKLCCSSTYFYTYVPCILLVSVLKYTRKGKSTVALHFSHYKRISFLEQPRLDLVAIL